VIAHPRNRLRELREEDGLAAAEVARRIDVDAGAISQWENGISGIPDWRKQQLAEMFKVSVAFLMGWDQPNGNGDNGGLRLVA
jgi:transcriptional regulator with XRE-family HTH domain